MTCSSHNETDGIVLTEVVQTCGMCPSQWDAWDAEGTYYYVRYRSGLLTVNRGEVMGDLLFGAEIGDPLDGFMFWDDVEAHTGMRFDDA